MIVYHVTTLKKLKKYIETGMIKAPVRAWDSEYCAAQFSKQTGRQIILRLKFPDNTERLAGHKNHAYVLNVPYTKLEKL